MTHAFPTRRASDLSSLHKSIQGRGRHFVDLRQLFEIGYYALTQRYSDPRYFHFAYLPFLLSSYHTVTARKDGIHGDPAGDGKAVRGSRGWCRFGGQRSEGRSVGKVCVSPCRSRWSPRHKKNK